MYIDTEISHFFVFAFQSALLKSTSDRKKLSKVDFERFCSEIENFLKNNSELKSAV